MSKLNNNYGFISLLYSIGNNPLGLWSKYVSPEGRVRRIEDETLYGDRVIEIRGPDNSLITTNISCPANPLDYLNIKLPILVIVLKNLKARLRIDFQIIDEEQIRRRFILSTYEISKKGFFRDNETARIFLKLEDDWNKLEIDLNFLCQTIYHTEYKALRRLIIYQNCRLRRIHMQDRHYENHEAPIQLCQAFFDMYMLKWGINFVEKSCQTSPNGEECRTVTPINATSDNMLSLEKLISLKKHQLLNSIDSREPKAETLRKEVGKSTKKNKISKVETHGKQRKIILRKNEKGSSSVKVIPMSMPSEKKTIKKENENEGQNFNKWLHNHQQSEQSAIKGNSKLNNFIHMSTANSSIIEAKSSKVFHSDNHKLIKETKPLAECIIPPEVEKEANAESGKMIEPQKSKLLVTDEAVRNYLELRHVINRKILEKFRSRGFTMTEVELSIYNSKNRQNSYGQDKIVERRRTSLEKACHIASQQTIENLHEKSVEGKIIEEVTDK